MSEERAQILEMLVAGRVTVDQADRLLQALDAASPVAPQNREDETPRQGQWDEPVDDFFMRLTPEQLIELRDNGVTRAFIDAMLAAGIRNLSVDAVINLYDHGVTPTFVRDLQE